MDEQTEQPKKKRGWPAGKPRGPRKPKEPTAAPPEATSGFITFVPPEPTYAKLEPSRVEPPEPVSVEAITTTGQRISFAASGLLIQNGRYVFTSYPAQRGYKRVTILRADQMASFTVTAPEDIAEMLKAIPAAEIARLVQPFPGTDAVAGGMGAGPIVYGPPLQRPPYADPRQAWKDPRAESAATIPNPAGIPASEISGSGDREVFGEHKKMGPRRPEIIGATMG